MFTQLSLNKFINEYIVKLDLDDILEQCKTQSEKGFVYERIWDLVIKFGMLFLNNEYIHKIGNSNNGKLKTMKSLKQYIQDNNVISGNSGGCSDITLKNNDEYIFITCKYPKSDEDVQSSKSVKYYDVQNIIAMIDANKEIYKKFTIYTLVPNKRS